jgi:serine/threonine protein kinase
MPAPEFFGPYIVHEQLGTGGMATVHRAIKQGIGGFERAVALKRLHGSAALDDGFVRDLVREARLASQLCHPNIAQIYDLGRAGETYYIALELVNGHDLRKVLSHAHRSVGPLPVPVVLDILAQVCDALDCAHRLGIIHRDISPANLIVGHDGIVKVIDFGIAKAQGSTLHTATGILKGKFSYIAPEYLRTGELDVRGDLFGLGVVGYELLTARPLFTGATDYDTLDRVRNLEVPPASTLNREVPASVDRLLATALARDPAQRWQSASLMRDAIEVIRSRLPRQSAYDWIDWAMHQPARPPLAELAIETRSVAIELHERTRLGVAPPVPGEVMVSSRPAPRPVEPPRPTLPGWGMPAPVRPPSAPITEPAGRGWIAALVAVCMLVAFATYVGLDLLTG